MIADIVLTFMKKFVLQKKFKVHSKIDFSCIILKDSLCHMALESIIWIIVEL